MEKAQYEAGLIELDRLGEALTPALDDGCGSLFRYFSKTKSGILKRWNSMSESRRSDIKYGSILTAAGILFNGAMVYFYGAPQINAKTISDFFGPGIRVSSSEFVGYVSSGFTTMTGVLSALAGLFGKNATHGTAKG